MNTPNQPDEYTIQEVLDMVGGMEQHLYGGHVKATGIQLHALCSLVVGFLMNVESQSENADDIKTVLFGSITGSFAQVKDNLEELRKKPTIN